MVKLYLKGVSDGRVIHQELGKVIKNSLISNKTDSKFNSSTRSGNTFTLRQIHFIKSSVNFGRALVEQVSFKSLIRAQFKLVKFVASKTFKQIPLTTFKYCGSSTASSLVSAIKVNSTDISCLIACVGKLLPNDGAKKNAYVTCNKG